MNKKKNLFNIFTQNVVYNYHIVKTEEPNGHLVYLIKNGSKINVDTLEFDPTVIVEKLISKCGIKIEKFAPSIFFTEENNTEKLKYDLEDKLTTDSNFSEFIESIKDEYRILEVKDSLLFKKDPEEYKRIKQEEHNEKQKDLLEQYGKQIENQKNQREKHILSYNNNLIKLLKEYFNDIIEYEKRDFNFDNELKKIVSSLADIESWIKIDKKPFICNIKICSIEQDKLNVFLTDNSEFYTATLRFNKTVLVTENVVKINENNTLSTEMTDYEILAQLYNVDFTTIKNWEFKNETERFEYTIDYLVPIFKLEKDKKQQEMVNEIQKDIKKIAKEYKDSQDDKGESIKSKNNKK